MHVGSKSDPVSRLDVNYPVTTPLIGLFKTDGFSVVPSRRLSKVSPVSGTGRMLIELGIKRGYQCNTIKGCKYLTVNMITM